MRNTSPRYTWHKPNTQENAFKKYAPNGIEVERDDGEDVLLKYNSRFSLTLLTNTVTDLNVKLDKE